MNPRCGVPLLFALIGCGSSDRAPSESVWKQDASELVSQGEAVIEAVASLPECTAAVRRGGHIRWRYRLESTTCEFFVQRGCGHLEADWPVLEIMFESSWGPMSESSWPDRSTLASMLCGICGYVGWGVDSCAERARAAYIKSGGRPMGEAWLSAWSQDASELLREGDAMIAAVATIPSCRAAMERGGQIRWRAQLASCMPCNPQVLGCYQLETCGPQTLVCYQSESELPRVEVIFESGFRFPANLGSALAHELCHVCGYVDEMEAYRCEYTARDSFHWQ